MARVRKSKEEHEHELNEVYRLIVAGISDRDIKNSRGISDRNFIAYKQKLRDKIINDAMSKREEYFIMDVATTEDGLQRDRRTFLEIMSDPKAPAIAKVTAAKEDRDTQIVILKLKHEGSLYIHALKSRQTNILQLGDKVETIQ